MRFINKKIIFIAFALISNSLYANEMKANNTTAAKTASVVGTIAETFGTRYSFDSKLLAEKRELLIHIPQEQQSGDKYPVLYLLDGESHFNHAVMTAQTLHQGGMMPPVIIVGIPNNTGQRRRDVYSGRDNFTAFIEQEVMPYIDASYNTSGHTTVFGHSAMGLLTMSIFATNNPLFDQYIAASPAVDHTDTELFGQLEQLFLQHKLANKSIYFSVTDKDREISGFTDGAIYLSNLFTQKAPKDLLWHYAFIPGQNHSTTPYLTVYQGLSKVFSDYQAPAFNNYQHFVDTGGMKGLSKFFSKRGEKYSSSKKIPQQMVTSLSYQFMPEGHADEAIEILKSQAKNYDNPMQIYIALGNIYSRMEKMPLAIKAFQQALALDPKTEPELTTFLQNSIAQMQQMGKP